MARGLTRGGKKGGFQAVDFWISYSDLMAGLMMVFVLLLMGVLLVLSTEAEHAEQALKQQREELERQSEEMDQQREAAEARQKELIELRLEVQAVLGVRAQLLRRIKERFDKAGSNIEFDDATGAVRLGSDILFGEGSATLTPAGQAALRSALPTYLEALLGDAELGRHVDRISIEGHTNSNYSGSSDPAVAYLFNLRLSQERAYAALEYIIQTRLGERYNARNVLVANGYSSSRLLLNPATQQEDKTRSRRIEIRFRLKDEETLEELSRRLKAREVP